MFPTVVIRQPGQTPIHLSVREPIEVGRECTGVLLVDPQVSRRHLVLAPVGDRVAVLDLGSTNGTILHGRRLDIEMELMAGQFIKLGDTTITVLDERSGATSNQRDSVPTVADEAELSTTVLPSAQREPSPATYRDDLDLPPSREHTPASEWSRDPRGSDDTSKPLPRDHD
ncbi:MAG TPA: FHA domain-containing protein [Ilumatobacter sp.]|nr:FHA domain-containing protein [Ilumatobacter sp.]